MFWGYNLIWGKTFFGKEVLSQYATNQKIALYQTFQDIRDPVGAEHKNVSLFSYYGYEDERDIIVYTCCARRAFMADFRSFKY